MTRVNEIRMSLNFWDSLSYKHSSHYSSKLTNVPQKHNTQQHKALRNQQCALLAEKKAIHISFLRLNWPSLALTRQTSLNRAPALALYLLQKTRHILSDGHNQLATAHLTATHVPVHKLHTLLAVSCKQSKQSLMRSTKQKPQHLNATHT